MQGIPWSTSPVSRSQFRAARQRDYLSVERAKGIPIYAEEHALETSAPRDDHYYDFAYMTKIETSTVHHFQLRHLLWAPSGRAVYYANMNRVRCWNPSSNDSHIVVNMSQYGLTYARASTIAATDRWLAVGGFAGDLLIKPLGETPHDPEPPPVAKTISRDPLSITNHLCPIRQDRLLVSSNDCVVRVLDISSMSITEAFTFPYPINASCVSPEGERMMAIVGDSLEASVIDRRSGQTVVALTGHLDHSFSISWSPCGSLLATASQDHTARVYDLRRADKSIAVLPSEMAAVRSIHFQASRFLVMAEADDFVHLYDWRGGLFDRRQVIDFFGEIGGVASVGECIYIAIAGGSSNAGSNSGGGIIEMQRAMGDEHCFGAYKEFLR